MIVNKKADKIVKEVKSLCIELFKNKLCAVYLYGSYARGDFNKYSDVDILITVNIPDKQIMKYRKHILEIDNNLTLKYDVMVSIVVVPIKRFTRFIDILPFYKNVLTQGINYGN